MRSAELRSGGIEQHGHWDFGHEMRVTALVSERMQKSAGVQPWEQLCNHAPADIDPAERHHRQRQIAGLRRIEAQEDLHRLLTGCTQPRDSRLSNYHSWIFLLQPFAHRRLHRPLLPLRQIRKDIEEAGPGEEALVRHPAILLLEKPQQVKILFGLRREIDMPTLGGD